MDELEISGKRYLSTRRAAKEHKYTSDYVGQLIRGGKVVGKKVGRSWYVSEESLNAYLSGEQGAPTPIAKVTVVEPMAEESKPAPVVEPVAEVIVVQKESPAVEVEEQKEEEKIETVIIEKIPEEKIFEPVFIKTTVLEEHHIPIRTSTPAPQKPSIGLRYIADDEPALPTIKRKAPVTTIPVESSTYAMAEEDIEEEVVENIPRKRNGALAFVSILVVGLTTLAATAALSTTLNSRIVVEQGQVANIGYTFQ